MAWHVCIPIPCRRRVMATLGELLFYIATQQQDAQNGATAQEVSDCWNINRDTINAVTKCVSCTSRTCYSVENCATFTILLGVVFILCSVGCYACRLLKPSEDEVAQHYAVKTIENICSQGGDWAAKFCSQDVAYSLVQIYSSTKNENLKATAASTMARLLRHSPTLVAFVVDKFGTRLFVQGLQDSSSKVQTAAVNMLNMALGQPDLSTRAKASLSEERSLVTNLMGLLDHSLPILRAKGVVAIHLLCRCVVRTTLSDVSLIARIHKALLCCADHNVSRLARSQSLVHPTSCPSSITAAEMAAGYPRAGCWRLASPSSFPLWSACNARRTSTYSRQSVPCVMRCHVWCLPYASRWGGRPVAHCHEQSMALALRA